MGSLYPVIWTRCEARSLPGEAASSAIATISAYIIHCKTLHMQKKPCLCFWVVSNGFRGRPLCWVYASVLHMCSTCPRSPWAHVSSHSSLYTHCRSSSGNNISLRKEGEIGPCGLCGSLLAPPLAVIGVCRHSAQKHGHNCEDPTWPGVTGTDEISCLLQAGSHPAMLAQFNQAGRRGF